MLASAAVRAARRAAAPARGVATRHEHAPERILSGIQPTGVPHLGNYLGAVVNWVRLQEAVAGGAGGGAGGGGGGGAGAGGGGRVLYSIVDLHAITVPYDAAGMPTACREMAASLLACGIDPRRATLFRQSAVREHTELAWVLGCLTPLGWLRRMTQFKDKSSKLAATGGGKGKGKGKGGGGGSIDSDAATNGVGLGLLAYPVLQAADILLYRATAVPVGDDQRQHLELARDIATAFNHAFCGGAGVGGAGGRGQGGGGASGPAHVGGAATGAGAGAGASARDSEPPCFPLPKALIVGDGSAGSAGAAAAEGEGDEGEEDDETTTRRTLAPSDATDVAANARVMSLRDARSKMSKSDPSDNSRINLTDGADSIARKVRRAVTDALPGITYDPLARPELANLLAMHAAVDGTGRSPAQVAAELDAAGAGAAGLKASLTEALVGRVVPIGREIERLMAAPGHIDAVLAEGADAAREVAAATMDDVRRLTGLR